VLAGRAATMVWGCTRAIAGLGRSKSKLINL
jgi:hypothetical protein